MSSLHNSLFFGPPSICPSPKGLTEVLRKNLGEKRKKIKKEKEGAYSPLYSAQSV